MEQEIELEISNILESKIIGTYAQSFVMIEKRKFFNFIVKIDDKEYEVPEINLETIKFEGKNGVIHMIIGTSPMHAIKFLKYIERHNISWEDIPQYISDKCHYNSIEYLARKICEAAVTEE